MPISNKDIARYYDRHQIIYTLFWSRTALHYGFWYEDTKSLAEAVLNTNRFVVDALAIDSRDTVLDQGESGCPGNEDLHENHRGLASAERVNKRGILEVP